MNTAQIFAKSYEFNRARTLGLLDAIEQLPNPQAVLAWRPGPGRAHIGWQLMHIAITEEVFATERLATGRQAAWPDLVPRFRSGSTPDENVPSPAEIRQKLSESRSRLLETLADYGDDRLDEIPEPFKARGWSIRDVLHVIGWHEGHHQGQAHVTLNLYKAAHPSV